MLQTASAKAFQALTRKLRGTVHEVQLACSRNREVVQTIIKSSWHVPEVEK